MQVLYDALEAARPQAYEKQRGETLEAWFHLLALSRSGTVGQIGGEDVADVVALDHGERFVLSHAIQTGMLAAIPKSLRTKLADLYGGDWQDQLGQRIDASRIPRSHREMGILYIYASPSADGARSPVHVTSCRLRSGPGDHAAIRDWFVVSGKKVREFSMPKVIVVPVGDRKILSVAWTPDNSTWDLASSKINVNRARAWLAGYAGYDTGTETHSGEVKGYAPAGVKRLEEEILDRTLSELGITRISS